MLISDCQHSVFSIRSRLRFFTLLEPIHQPRLRNEKQWRQEHAEEAVEPDQSQIKADEAKGDPECAQRAVRFHALLQCGGGLHLNYHENPFR